MRSSRTQSGADVVLALTYYSPYVSGLTNVARDVAEALAARGASVRVITTRHDMSLPECEERNGVAVERCPVVARVGKGTISPQFTRRVIEASRHARVLNLHAPLLEAGLIASRSHCPVVFTYQCDVSLPPGALNEAQRRLIDLSSRAAMHRSHSVICTSLDYARHSRLWTDIEPRVRAVAPPCKPVSAGSPSYRDGEGLHVGFLGRVVEEKGLEYLVDGFLRLPDPDARLLIGGDFSQIAGGSVVERVRERIGADPRIHVLGFIPDAALGDFYASLDCFVLPSVNAFEAFGIVQVVAMLAGIPVIATDLPGVRTPVQETAFGVIVPPRDPAAITRALVELRDGGFDRSAGAARAAALYNLDRAIDGYEEAFAAAAGTLP